MHAQHRMSMDLFRLLYQMDFAAKPALPRLRRHYRLSRYSYHPAILTTCSLPGFQVLRARDCPARKSEERDSWSASDSSSASRYQSRLLLFLQHRIECIGQKPDLLRCIRLEN